MISTVIFFFLFLHTPLSATATVHVIMYNNARFDPFNAQHVFANLISISSDNACLCECYRRSMCLMASYFAIDQTCFLLSAQLNEGQLGVVPTIAHAKLFIFVNTSFGGE